MGRWGGGVIGRWGVLDISPNPIIKSILTHFLSITSPENLFSGDTVRASIESKNYNVIVLNSIYMVLA